MLNTLNCDNLMLIPSVNKIAYALNAFLQIKMRKLTYLRCLTLGLK